MLGLQTGRPYKVRGITQLRCGSARQFRQHRNMILGADAANVITWTRSPSGIYIYIARAERLRLSGRHEHVHAPVHVHDEWS